MSKAFTFDLDSIEIVNKSKSEEVEPKVREGRQKTSSNIWLK